MMVAPSSTVSSAPHSRLFQADLARELREGRSQRVSGEARSKGGATPPFRAGHDPPLARRRSPAGGRSPLRPGRVETERRRACDATAGAGP